MSSGRSPRRTVRRRFGTAGAIALVVVALKLLSIGWFSHAGVSAYDDGDFAASQTNFGRLEVLNVVEPWKAHFNRGVARYQADDLDGAEASFRAALDAGGNRCAVVANLVLTIETQGDRLADDDADAARTLYTEARELADLGDCQPDADRDPEDPRTVVDDARARLDAKLEPPPTEDTEPTASTEPAAEPDASPTPSQQEQLEAINETAAEANRELSGDSPDTQRPDTGAW